MHSRAPAPLSVVKGGASPSRDLHALAKSDDLAAYVKARAIRGRGAQTMSFSRRIRNIEVAADPASGDDVRFILGHYGEDATRIRNAYRREHPTIGVRSSSLPTTPSRAGSCAAQ